MHEGHVFISAIECCPILTGLDVSCDEFSHLSRLIGYNVVTLLTTGFLLLRFNQPLKFFFQQPETSKE